MERKPFDDGGPAFPQHGWSSNPEVLARMANQGGMSLRDYFAAHALHTFSDDEGGTVADAEKELGIATGSYNWRKHWPMMLARRAYAIADAMLAERVKQEVDHG